ncbi:MAG: sigma-70 family RNA polymerase sigma factor [Ardenticatenaceae bacterium]
MKRSKREQTKTFRFQAVEMASLEDQMLLDIALSRPEAFICLWERYESYLYRRCVRWTKSEMDAEDVLSEVMLKARAAVLAKSIRNFKAWVTRLSYNLCMNMYHKRARHAQRTIYLEDMPEAGEELIGFKPNPLETVVHNDLLREVKAAMLQLPAHLREPIRLHSFSHMSYNEIAAQLGIEQALVRKRIQLGHAMLQTQLTDHNTPTERQAEIKVEVMAIYPVQVTGATGRQIFHLPLRQKASNFDKKVASLQKHVRRYPSGWKRRWQLADALVASGRWEEAIPAYRHVLSKQPRHLDLSLQLGQILHLSGRQAEAIAVYEQALPVASLESTQHHLRGLIASCQTQQDLAIHHFEMATSLEAHNPAHWHACGLTYLRAAKPALARQAFEQALKLDPNDLMALTHSCEALIALECYEEAQQRAALASKLDPSNLLALKRLADARLQSGLIWGPPGQESKRVIRKALRLAPDAPDIIDLLARYHLSRDEKQKAQRVQAAFAKKHPNAVHSHQ